MLRHSAAILAILLVSGGPLAAQRTGSELTGSPSQPTTRIGTRGANFLEIGVGARAQAMGGAMAGLASGAASMYWNPAGLASLDGVDMAFSRSDLYSGLGITHDFAAAAIPFAGGAAGVSYIRLDSGNIPRTDESFPAGDNPTYGQYFSWSGTAIGIHYGRRLTDRLQVGFSGRVISEGMNDAQAHWWGLDFGTIFNTGLYGITLGAALVNIGPSAAVSGQLITQRVNARDAFPVAIPVQYHTTAYQLPSSFRFSVVSNLMGGPDALLSPSGTQSLKLALDLNDGVDTDMQAALGAEYSIHDLVFLRAGKRWVNEGPATQAFYSFSTNLSFGGGIRLPMFGRHFSFDYAYTNMGELQNVQVFSFELGGH